MVSDISNCFMLAQRITISSSCKLEVNLSKTTVIYLLDRSRCYRKIIIMLLFFLSLFLKQTSSTAWNLLLFACSR